MFFFNIGLLPFLIFGIFVFLFFTPINNYLFKDRQDALLNIPIIRKTFTVWMPRAIGIIAIGVFFYMGMNRPYMGMMKKDENRLVLLEHGKIAEGSIVKGWFDNWAPSAWMVLYNFKAPNPANGEEKTYWGSARGPKKHYGNLSEGDTVKIIYNPSNPKINCEMYCFINHPSYRRTFREAGKLDLLSKFRDEYEFETYSEMKWYNMAMQR